MYYIQLFIWSKWKGSSSDYLDLNGALSPCCIEQSKVLKPNLVLCSNIYRFYDFFDKRKAPEIHVELLNLKGGILYNFIYTALYLREGKNPLQSSACVYYSGCPKVFGETITSHLSIDRPHLLQKISIHSEWSVGLGFVHGTCVQVFLLTYCLWILSQRLFSGGVLSNRCFALIRYSGCEQVHTASIETEFMCSSGLFNLWCSFHWPRKWVARILMCLTLQEEIKNFFTTLNL